MCPLVALGCGDHLGQVQTGHAGRSLGGGNGLVNALLRHRFTHCQTNDGAVLRTQAAQPAGELARVDVGNGHRTFAHQVGRQGFGGAEVADQQGQVLDDKACGLDFSGFDVLGIDPVTANVRVRECHDLLAVAGVSEDFLVAGHGGVEHHFADGGASGTNRIADKDRAVCERQDGGREISL